MICFIVFVCKSWFCLQLTSCSVFRKILVGFKNSSRDPVLRVWRKDQQDFARLYKIPTLDEKNLEDSLPTFY